MADKMTHAQKFLHDLVISRKLKNWCLERDLLMIATTNLCENMDKAFERRFLFKVKYEKPSLEARENIWRTKLNTLGTEAISKLAKEFDFSGGEIDNIVRKCEMNEIIKGAQPDYEEIVELCKTERLENAEEHRMGFCS